MVSGVEPEGKASLALSDWLRSLWRRGRTVGGLCTGAYALAKAGILEGRQFTLHWENLPPFMETFAHLTPVEQLYCIDDRILTCAGGVAAVARRRSGRSCQRWHPPPPCASAATPGICPP